jgi:hypothetical protein
VIVSKAMIKAVALLSGFVVAGCSVVGVRSGTEEPPYTVDATIGAASGATGGATGSEIEIRTYGPRLVAETFVEADEEAARNAGFRRLAAYIFGGNTARQDIAMTAPVAQTSEPIAMTAPVAQESAAAGRWRIRFFMPARYTMATLPRPNDSDVQIAEVPAQQVAVLRFSGDRSAAAVAAQQQRLLAALAATPWRATGTPSAWFYDPPWTLPGLRRNEVSVAVTRTP